MNNKIIQYLKENSADLLFSNFCKFFIDKKEQNILREKYFPENSFPKQSSNIINNTEWFLLIEEPELLYPIGIYSINNEQSIVITFDHNGYFKYMCDKLADLPFAMLVLQNEYLVNRELIYQKLYEYENWCKNNNISIDKHNIFHDNKKICNHFDKYYEYEENKYYEYFPKEEDQRF